MPRQGLAEPALDEWLAEPALRVCHRRASLASPDELWDAARSVTLRDAAALGRVIRWRIPGLDADLRFDELFRQPPFTVLHEDAHALVSGLVGRIWTPRRDYPELGSAEEFREWSKSGTAKVAFANWVTAGEDGEVALVSETRVVAFGRQGAVGIAAVRPLVRAFEQMIGSEAIAAAVRRAG